MTHTVVGWLMDPPKKIREKIEWICRQWAIERREQHRIAKDLGYASSPPISAAIYWYCATEHPEWMRVSRYGEKYIPWGEERRALLAGTLPVARATRSRPIDMGGPRDVWLEFYVPPDPRFDNMAPVEASG